VASKDAGLLGQRRCGPGQRRWTWPAKVDLAGGEAEGKECSLLTNQFLFHCNAILLVTTNTSLARTVSIECLSLVLGLFIITTIIVWYYIRIQKEIDAINARIDAILAELHRHDHNDNEASNPLVDENEESGFGAFAAPGRRREISSPNTATTANASATADSTTEDATATADTASPIQDQTRDQDQDEDEDENVSIFCQIFSISIHSNSVPHSSFL
jgi:hypothetical protein